MLDDGRSGFTIHSSRSTRMGFFNRFLGGGKQVRLEPPPHLDEQVRRLARVAASWHMARHPGEKAARFIWSREAEGEYRVRFPRYDSPDLEDGQYIQSPEDEILQVRFLDNGEVSTRLIQ
jgi:hypothetical protein